MTQRAERILKFSAICELGCSETGIFQSNSSDDSRWVMVNINCHLHAKTFGLLNPYLGKVPWLGMILRLIAKLPTRTIFRDNGGFIMTSTGGTSADREKPRKRISQLACEIETWYMMCMNGELDRHLDGWHGNEGIDEDRYPWARGKSNMLTVFIYITDNAGGHDTNSLNRRAREDNMPNIWC